MVLVSSAAEVTAHLDSGNSVLLFLGDDATSQRVHDAAQTMRAAAALAAFEVPIRVTNPAWIVSERLPNGWKAPQSGDWVTLRMGAKAPFELEEVSRGPATKLLDKKGEPDPFRILAAFTGAVP